VPLRVKGRQLLLLTSRLPVSGGRFSAMKQRLGISTKSSLTPAQQILWFKFGYACLRVTGKSVNAMKDSILDVEIEPRMSALQSLGISGEEFVEALMASLERLDGVPRGELPRARDIPIYINGQDMRLGNVAAIAVRMAEAQGPADGM
jgi:hypothetical protein